MDTPHTCGRGLAEHSPLPIKLGELTDAVSTILEREVVTLLEGRLEQDAQMLAAMRDAGT